MKYFEVNAHIARHQHHYQYEHDEARLSLINQCSLQVSEHFRSGYYFHAYMSVYVCMYKRKWICVCALASFFFFLIFSFLFCQLDSRISIIYENIIYLLVCSFFFLLFFYSLGWLHWNIEIIGVLKFFSLSFAKYVADFFCFVSFIVITLQLIYYLESNELLMSFAK